MLLLLVAVLILLLFIIITIIINFTDCLPALFTLINFWNVLIDTYIKNNFYCNSNGDFYIQMIDHT